jgi:hypothetical protein
MDNSQIGLLAAQEEYFRPKAPDPPPKPKAANVHSGSMETDLTVASPTPSASSDSSYRGVDSPEHHSKTQRMPAKTGTKIIKFTKQRDGKLTARLATPPDKTNGQGEEMPSKMKPKKPNTSDTPKTPAPGFGIAPTPSQSQNETLTVPPQGSFTIPKFTISKQTSRSGRTLQATKKRAAAEISTDTEAPTETTPAEDHCGFLPKNNIKVTKDGAPKPAEDVAPKPTEHVTLKLAERLAPESAERIAAKTAKQIVPKPAGHAAMVQTLQPNSETQPSRIRQNPYAKRRVEGDDPGSVKFVKVDSDDEYSQPGYPHYAPERMRYCSKDHQWLPRTWYDRKVNGRLLHSCRYHGANTAPGPVPSKLEVRAELERLKAASLGEGEKDGVD